MARFAVRPEINNASSDDYTRLHEEMYKRNIYRVIQGADNVWYDLPTGTYRAFKELTLDQFYQLALDAILVIVNQYKPAKNYELIVFEFNQSRWFLNVNTDKARLPK